MKVRVQLGMNPNEDVNNKSNQTKSHLMDSINHSYHAKMDLPKIKQSM